MNRKEAINLRILLVGASGTIGQFVLDRLLNREHEVITAGRSTGDIQVDLTSTQSIENLFKKSGVMDAITSTAGAAAFVPVDSLTPEANQTAVLSKLLGQINLALIGQHYLYTEGSITLTTGIMKDDPIPAGASAAMANGGVAAFVKSAAIDLKDGKRMNCVSPNVLEESMDVYGESFVGFSPVAGKKVANAFLKSVEGKQTSQEYQIY